LELEARSRFLRVCFLPPDIRVPVVAFTRERTDPQIKRSGEMPYFYFHLFNDITSIDEEGADLPTTDAAMQRAATTAREMAAESVREGHLVLDHRIELANDAGQTIAKVRFGEVVKIEGDPTSYKQSG
jgi:hypothetical protein